MTTPDLNELTSLVNAAIAQGEKALLPLNNVGQINTVVNARPVLMRQERYAWVYDYTTEGMPTGYISAHCLIIRGAQAGETIDITLPITVETAGENLVKYYAVGIAWAPGTQVEGADGSRGTVSSLGYINIWQSGTVFQENTIVTFVEYGAGVTKIADPPA